MKLQSLTRLLPTWKNAALAVLSAVLLILAFPDFEFWFLAWFALVPLFWAIEIERRFSCPQPTGGQENLRSIRSFILGWVFGTVFFFGTCWWLTFAPITYAAFPWPLAYFLLFCVTAITGIFPGIFGAVFSVLLRRFGHFAILAAPFVWVFTELLRYWLTGNNWNAIGYSQAFSGFGLKWSSVGGVHLVSFIIVLIQSSLLLFAVRLKKLFQDRDMAQTAKMFGIQGLNPFLFWDVALDRGIGHKAAEGELVNQRAALYFILFPLFGLLLFYLLTFVSQGTFNQKADSGVLTVGSLVAIQPNVPMSGLTPERWRMLRQKHVELAESALQKLTTDNRQPTTVIFPESPMNFQFEEDQEFQQFVQRFADKNNVNVLFNSAEPDPANNKYFNSAVLVGRDGKEIAQYDKIYLVPFGESVPAPLQSVVPAFVGSFSYGSEYDLLPLGDARAGVMICFESHFGSLSREYVRNGADVLIEMTNDGYLGPTPILRQHLANAVFRAVETNRPVLRVTNVGITAYINERGDVLSPTESYTEDTRVWSVSKSEGSQTFYVRYGDWFAWLCSIFTLALLAISLNRPKKKV